ncbi:hypothetical protein FOZ60_009214 [Perkinsus olseni]|uniref:Uncharacterized protein n=1 Tax=Perkinsus olseni TaxID=32597 RepID=A0A7J6PFF3_PEROL|nr:hypothetical protein FOZ60_009214 [Perkinsus olseni]
MTFSRLIIVAAALADLAKHVEGTATGGARKRLGGRIRVENGMCELSSGTRKFGNFTVISLYFQRAKVTGVRTRSAKLCTPAHVRPRGLLKMQSRSTEDSAGIRATEDSRSGLYNIDLTEFDVSFTPDHSPLTITSNLQEAKQHFAARHALRPLEQTSGNSEANTEIFDILANNPRSDFEKGVQWFLDFHVWANSMVGELISDWERVADQ